MKKVFILSMIAGFALSFASCDKDEDTDQQLPYLFRPINITTENVGTMYTISWAKVDSALSYTIQISRDSLLFANIIDERSVELNRYVIELAPSTRFSARVRANAADISRDSKWNEITFKTPAENIFNGYSSRMSAQGTADVLWLPDANATSLLFKPQGGGASTSFDINAKEKETGEKICDGLANGTYTIEIYNNDIKRGTTTVTIEGDAFLSAGDDLKAAIANAAAGNVIVLEDGALFTTGTSAIALNKNIKIKGLNPSNKAIVAMSAGASGTASMWSLTDGSTFDDVTFENIDFSGYTNNETTNTKIGYLFNNNTAITVGAITFTGCNIHNIGNTPIRVQGNKNQVIETVTFDGCVITDIGYGSTYAIVNSNSADIINNIVFRNSTVYNFKGSLVLRTSQSFKSIVVENCTIDQGMTDATPRYLIDVNNATVNGDGIAIRNCILGSTGSTAGGVRPIIEKLSVSGSYYTSDYADAAAEGLYSIKNKMTAYDGASTALWTNPAAGIFTFKDGTFVGKSTAGDPRWK